MGPREGIAGVVAGRGSTVEARGCHGVADAPAGVIEVAVDRREARPVVGGIVIGSLGSVIVVPSCRIGSERCASYPEV
jgi:hypothetical protein